MRRVLLIATALSVLFSVQFAAQRPATAPGPAVSARATAPNDYTGYWVSEVTEKWRFRMLVPDKNDYTQIPLNPEGRKIAAMWDPAKDQASGEACRGYGAAAILQVPGRLHIYWQDDNTLRLDTDSGQQTRLFHFDAPAPAAVTRAALQAPTWKDSRRHRGAVASRAIVATGRAGQCRTRKAASSSRRGSRSLQTI